MSERSERTDSFVIGGRPYPAHFLGGLPMAERSERTERVVKEVRR